MPKSRPSRSPLAAALVAGSLCVGPGCASAPQTNGGPPPSPIPCPAGTAQTYKLYHTDSIADVVFEPSPDGYGLARDGEVLQVQIQLGWGNFAAHTPLVGRAWFGRDRVYGRLTHLMLPGGESLPICLDLDFNGPGVPMLPGSTRKVAIIPGSAAATVVPASMKP